MFFDANRLILLKQDVERRARKYKLKGLSAWKFFWSHPQNRTLAFYRWSHAARPLLFRTIFERLYLRSSRYSGLEILTPHLGGGVILPHWGRIILNARFIGEGLYVFHNVTIGNDYSSGVPSLGSNVFIGVSSVLLGNITIGNHVIIGAGSIVVKDIPSCSLVVGNPARVVKDISPDEIQRMIGY